MENLIVSTNSKAEKYQELLPQLQALTSGESSLTANLANISAALRQTFHFFWVGFYLVDNDDLVLGPFQGDIACTRIALGKGVCGTAWQREETIIVPNVDAFPNHIACSSQSKSEIVIPIFSNNRVVAVLDVDSSDLNDFDESDKIGLEAITKLISNLIT